MTSESEVFERSLKQHGFHITSARRQIFSCLLEASEPLTMHDLTIRCNNVDRASIYRTVALFEGLHIAKRVYTGWKYHLELGEQFSQHHHHATCRICGKIIALPGQSSLESNIVTICAAINFTMLSHELEIKGVCSKCKTNLRSSL